MYHEIFGDIKTLELYAVEHYKPFYPLSGHFDIASAIGFLGGPFFKKGLERVSLHDLTNPLNMVKIDHGWRKKGSSKFCQLCTCLRVHHLLPSILRNSKMKEVHQTLHKYIHITYLEVCWSCYLGIFWNHPIVYYLN